MGNFLTAVRQGARVPSTHIFAFRRLEILQRLFVFVLSVGGVLWCIVVYCGVLWCVVVYCGVLWCIVVYCGVDAPPNG